MLWLVAFKRFQKPSQEFHDRDLILCLWAQDDESGVVLWWIRSNIREVEIECDQNATFALNCGRNYGVISACETSC